ncbi:MAG: 5-amino-6-(5-phosphoribosylamino)uracil reductase [Methanobacteriales archaeon Met13]
MKPRVILNAAMTLDGKIATKTGSSEISGEKDLIRVHKLRQECDAIMVGINTLLADNPRLTVHKISADPADNPIRVVVDSQARTPLNFRILSKEAHTIIAVSEKAPQERADNLLEKAEVIVCGKERVNLDCLMDKLGDIGIKTLLLEGAGGSQAKTLVDGDGVDYMNDALKLRLKRSYSLDEDLILEYEVL